MPTSSTGSRGATTVRSRSTASAIPFIWRRSTRKPRGGSARLWTRSPALAAPLKTDATIRLADCLYYCGDARSAIDSYSAAIDAGAADADYALLRRATATHGSAGDQEAKIADLKRLRQRWPQSKWAAQALLEEGLACSDLGDARGAAAAFELLAEEWPQSAEARKAYAQPGHNPPRLGRRGRRGRGIQAADTPLAHIGGGQDGGRRPPQDTLTPRGARCRSLRGGSPESPGAPQLDTDEMERLAFDAAERLNDDASDTRRLEAYVEDYPDGRYLAQALYDLAEVRHEAKDYEGALAAAGSLIDRRPDSRQAPAALLLKAGILEKRLGRKAEALEAWRGLLRRGGADYSADACAGIMRTTGDPAEAVEYARRLRNSGGITAEQADEATLHEALALIAGGNARQGRDMLRALAAVPASESGARAAVELGRACLAQAA